MGIKGWKYYNHAMIPEYPPRKNTDTFPIQNGQIWKNVLGGGDTIACTMDKRLGLWI